MRTAHMPTISMFYGLIIRMYYFDNQKQKLIDAWIELRQEDLMADWKLAINGESVFKIDPLK